MLGSHSILEFEKEASNWATISFRWTVGEGVGGELGELVHSPSAVSGLRQDVV